MTQRDVGIVPGEGAPLDNAPAGGLPGGSLTPAYPLHEPILLADILAVYRPASANGRVWTWEEEEADILARECLCCGVPGHYFQQLEAFLADKTVVEGVCVGPDGRVWDGHHRITAARRLGIEWVTLESPKENAERWLRDHGPVDWHSRKVGDRHTCSPTPETCAAPMHGTR